MAGSEGQQINTKATNSIRDMAILHTAPHQIWGLWLLPSSCRGRSLRQRASDLASLFDHLVGPGEDRRRHVEAERLGGLKVEDDLVLGRHSGP